MPFMKPLKILLILISTSIFSHNIIFVHLGGPPPACILTTIEQARYFNQNCDIYLLTDSNGVNYFQGTEFFEKHNIQLIDCDLVPISKEHLTFREINPIDSSLSNGFWVYTTERFFTLFDFIQEQKLENVVHLESDTMIYIDLNELFLIFQKQGIKIAAPFQSLKGCIPCFVFIKDSESLSLLINHMLSEMIQYKGIKPYLNLNDMQTLASFYLKFGSSNLLPLPTLMQDYSHSLPKRKSRFVPDNTTPLSFLSQNSELFPGFLFDAAGLGIYINGNDERFSKSHGPKTIHARSLFNPGLFTYFWGRDSEERTVPYILFKGKKYQIINLHFHSKKPNAYTSFLPERGEFP